MHGARPAVHTFNPPARPKAASSSQNEILPEIQGILNDESFWIAPWFRLPNFEEVVERYADARSRIFEEAEKEKRALRDSEVTRGEQRR